MATPSSVTALYRQGLLQLRAVTLRDLLALWPVVRWEDIPGTWPAFATAARLILERDRNAAATLGQAYLAAHRTASGVPGDPVIIPPMPLPEEQVTASLTATGLAQLLRSSAAGQTSEQALANGYVTVSGAVSRLALNGARDTVRYSTLADSATVGWQRATAGDACPFCRMLAGRGAVYSAETADFSAHDHCSCSASPAYADLVGPGVTVRPYEPSSRVQSEADRARTRAWIAQNT